MDELISKYIPKSAPSDDPWSISGVIAMGIFIEAALLIGGIKANYLTIQILCFVLMPLPILLGLRMIYEVNFQSEITVKPILGKAKAVKYSQLRKFYKGNVGRSGMYVWILKYDQNKKLKKITFYDDDLNFEEFRKVLSVLKNKDNINQKPLDNQQ